MRRLLALLVASSLGTAQAQDVPEAAAAFAQRQADLVALAGHLGELHRLRQLCFADENPDLFRRRMMALVPLEVPAEATRKDMIAAFNEGYRAGAGDHAICGQAARADYREASEEALGVTERLYAPFRR